MSKSKLYAKDTKLTPQAWETWSVITTMLELALKKMEKEPNKNPILWASSVKNEGKHKWGIVYRTFTILNDLGITRSIDDEYPWGVEFTVSGIKILKDKINYLPRGNELQRKRVEIISKLLDVFDREIKRSVP